MKLKPGEWAVGLLPIKMKIAEFCSGTLRDVGIVDYEGSPHYRTEFVCDGQTYYTHVSAELPSDEFHNKRLLEDNAMIAYLDSLAATRAGADDKKESEGSWKRFFAPVTSKPLLGS